jgi:hypothetical protein
VQKLPKNRSPSKVEIECFKIMRTKLEHGSSGGILKKVTDIENRFFVRKIEAIQKRGSNLKQKKELPLVKNHFSYDYNLIF